jgi:phospholipid/cholesterol/gamma-HCH transport system substrate-binding protein
MEIRARYVQMGAFTMAVVILGFGFVYWLNNAGALREVALYRVAFEGPVSGLLRGSAVLFNGVRVGEVTALELDPSRPRQVQATIAVERNVPVRIDTQVAIDFQGLTGSPVIALVGGSSTVPIAAAKGELPLLMAEAGAGQSMSQAARDALRRLDAVLADNAQPLRSAIANLDAFSGALARNSDRVDGIVAGLERMTGGAAAKARVVIFDLGIPRAPDVMDKALGAQIVVPDPTALTALDSEKIQTTSADGAITGLPDAQWGDTLPRLLQTKIIRSLEDSNSFAGVSRPMDGLIGDFQLLIDIRKFQIAPGLVAEVEFGAKVIDSKGRIVATRIFRASVAAQSSDPSAAVAALDQALAKAGPDLVGWAARTISEQGAPRPVIPKKATNG